MLFRSPSVQCEQAPGGSVAVVFSPVGEFFFLSNQGVFGPTVGDTAMRARLDLLRALPSGLRMRAVVMPPDPADGYGWTDFGT